MTALTALATHPGPYADGGFHWWFLFFPFGFFLFWVLFFVALRTLVFRRWGGPWGGGPGRPGYHRGPGAEQVLAGRFAAGDIDEQEYRARLEVLRASPPTHG
jgi:putative membrane protein